MTSLEILDWDDLVSKDADSEKISKSLERAFGKTGLGVVAIRGVPGFVDAKKSFLSMAHSLATLPGDVLENKLTDPDSLYNAGWSHGKEKLGDKPDLAKGSFYYNPVTDVPGTEEDRQKYPLSYPKNIWPEDSLIPGFEEAAKKIGCILRDATIQLTQHLDAIAYQHYPDSYPQHLLHTAMKDTVKVKARLLYYFPIAPDSVLHGKPDSWIGWHNDSGFLTALAGDMYVDHKTGNVVDCPDPKAGLYVASRSAATEGAAELRVEIPPDCLAVQMGECTQIVTGGTFSATPHCVRGASNDHTVARISLPCFVDTPPTFSLSAPPNVSREQILAAAVPHPKVPPLEKRWVNGGMTFGDFLQKTFSLYFDWSKK